MAGLQCPKRLWLQVHKPDLIPSDLGESLPIINGNEVGELARRLFPGSLVEYKSGLAAALETTQSLIADSNVKVIHEATFCHDGILVRVDILERNSDGWILTEVKGSTSVKSHYLHDAAIQVWVLVGSGLNIKSVRLMHLNNQFVYMGDGKYDGLLVSQNIDAEVKGILGSIQEQKDELVAALNGDEPDIGMGPQCDKPYVCEFCSYCMPENIPEYPVTILPNLREPKKSDLTSRYSDVREIPESELTNANHLRVLRVTKNGEEEVDIAEASALSELPWPRYYLDFETVALAVPRWEGTKPYMQVLNRHHFPRHF